MLVKVTREHTNNYGKNYEKKVGDEYEHPSPEVLIEQKLVERVKGEKADVAAKPAKSEQPIP